MTFSATIELVERHTILAVGGGGGGPPPPPRRGVYAAPTRLFWSLIKPPTHLDGPLPEQFSWEVERFCELARQANPTVLEVLWSPIVEKTTGLGQALRSARPAFLSRRVEQTYGAYARDQLTRVANRRARTGQTNHKQAMHMIRLLHAGIHVLRTGEVLVDVTPLRDRLLAVRSGAVPFPEVEAWAAELQLALSEAAAATALPPVPDLTAIDQLLHRVREEGLQ
jgi:hypothetical protein